MISKSIIVVLAATCIVAFKPWSPEQDYFKRPVRQVGADRRISPNPAWITTKWVAAEDKPFLAIEGEISRYRQFSGFEDGKWVKKALKAVEDWRKDHQDPVKLYRACAYVGVASEVDREFAEVKDVQGIATDLNYAWEVIKNPPRSYWFVRMGYRFSAGDGDKHEYGNLARALLKRNPLDRTVAKAAAGELWDELMWGSHETAYIVKFESFLINTLTRIRKTDLWRPWDDRAIASVYHTRAIRTRKRSDMQKAIDYTKSAISKCPPGYNVQHLKKNLAMYQERMKTMMKYD